MYDFTQQEYSCGHFWWIASKWCRDYTLTYKRCQPNIHFEFRAEEICGEYKPKAYPPWENMIKRSDKRTFLFVSKN
ncbi:hypothetical protein B0T25DRAFT_133571 [Lasiosphaeria hispida]|uniref:Uncharacterized protein n=1 Tax=Lasiosphaeria hispida TaxID=260671 RepID=A0AAJ0MIY4_9PEZI|nr:hypothetical protein B0T25DRAFT_133571 [Lasiosphaeria hispida]